MGTHSPTTPAAAPVTLKEYAERFRLHVHCPACSHEAPLNVMRWARVIGWNAPLETLRHSVRCTECGNNVGVEVRVSERELRDQQR